MGKGRRRSQETPDVEPERIQPVDVDGVRIIAVLTVAWAVAFVALAFAINWLDSNGRGWWLWTCLAGIGLGLLGLEYARKRRDALEDVDDEARPEAVDRDTVDSPAADPSPASTSQTAVSGLARDPDRRQPSSSPPGRVEGLAADRAADPRGDGPASVPPIGQQTSPNAVTRPIGGGSPGSTSLAGSVQPSRHSHPGQPRRPRSADPAGRPRLVAGITPGAGPVATPALPSGIAPPGSHNDGRARAERGGPGERRALDAPGSDVVGNVGSQAPALPGVPSTPRKRSTSAGPNSPSAAPSSPRSAGAGSRSAAPSSPRSAAAGSSGLGSTGPAEADDDLTGSLRRPAPPAPSMDDDEPLLDTTLGGGRRARRYDQTDEIDEVTEGGGRQYRGRRARRSDSA
jgi:hypothetical protein